MQEQQNADCLPFIRIDLNEAADMMACEGVTAKDIGNCQRLHTAWTDAGVAIRRVVELTDLGVYFEIKAAA